MNIPTVTETSHRAPAPPAPPVASTAGAASTPVGEAATPAPPASSGPAPAPTVGFDRDVLVEFDEATNRKVYEIVEPDSGESIQQIPAEAVLALVAKILERLEAEGLR